jgi:hypothetical protein
VFTVLLIVIVLYWLMVIIGAIGVDVLHVGEAAGGKIEGMVGGAVEGKIEGVVGGAVEGKIEGVAVERALGRGRQGRGRGRQDRRRRRVPGDAGLRQGPGDGRHQLAGAVVVGAVPVAGVGRRGSSGSTRGLVAAWWRRSWRCSSGVLTGLIVRALGRFLVHHEPLRRRDLVGKLCTITTGGSTPGSARRSSKRAART